MLDNYKKCENCLNKIEPGSSCIHPMKCLELGWMGRLRCTLFGWREDTNADEIIKTRLASAIFDTESTGRLQEHPEELDYYEQRAESLIHMSKLNGIEIVIKE